VQYTAKSEPQTSSKVVSRDNAIASPSLDATVSSESRARNVGLASSSALGTYPLACRWQYREEGSDHDRYWEDTEEDAPNEVGAEH